MISSVLSLKKESGKENREAQTLVFIDLFLITKIYIICLE